MSEVQSGGITGNMLKEYGGIHDQVCLSSYFKKLTYLYCASSNLTFVDFIILLNICLYVFKSCALVLLHAAMLALVF